MTLISGSLHIFSLATLWLSSLNFFFSVDTIHLLILNLTFSKDIAYFDRSKNNVGALTTRLATDASLVQGVSILMDLSDNALFTPFTEFVLHSSCIIMHNPHSRSQETRLFFWIWAQHFMMMSNLLIPSCDGKKAAFDFIWA